MNATQDAKTQIQEGLDFLSACVDGMSDEQYNWKPSGTSGQSRVYHAIFAMASAIS